ncbi:MAG: hypothetical protein WDW38_010985 [Sanguina aurantia]
MLTSPTLYVADEEMNRALLPSLASSLAYQSYQTWQQQRQQQSQDVSHTPGSSDGSIGGGGGGGGSDVQVVPGVALGDLLRLSQQMEAKLRDAGPEAAGSGPKQQSTPSSTSQDDHFSSQPQQGSKGPVAFDYRTTSPSLQPNPASRGGGGSGTTGASKSVLYTDDPVRYGSPRLQQQQQDEEMHRLAGGSSSGDSNLGGRRGGAGGAFEGRQQQQFGNDSLSQARNGYGDAAAAAMARVRARLGGFEKDGRSAAVMVLTSLILNSGSREERAEALFLACSQPGISVKPLQAYFNTQNRTGSSSSGSSSSSGGSGGGDSSKLGNISLIQQMGGGRVRGRSSREASSGQEAPRVASQGVVRNMGSSISGEVRMDEAATDIRPR